MRRLHLGSNGSVSASLSPSLGLPYPALGAWTSIFPQPQRLTYDRPGDSFDIHLKITYECLLTEDLHQTLISEGYNIFRIPFLLERMARGSITAQLDSGYLKNLTDTVTHITGKGKFAVLDAHNYGRYNGAIITDTASFGTFWKNLATQFKSNANVVSGAPPLNVSRVPRI